MTDNITVTGGNADTKVAFKNCTSFKTCRTEINDVFVHNADYIYIAMHMHNPTVYSDNCSDTSGSLWQFKRDEINGNVEAMTTDSPSFKYKSGFIGNVAAGGIVKDTKLVVPLNYSSNF